jgi:hypothetical protein
MVDAMLRNLKVLCVDIKKRKRNKIVDWIPPSADILKFNVDGSTLGKPGLASIGGVLRDSTGMILCIFSCFLGILDSNTTELLAITRALELISFNSNLSNREIIVVSDSNTAVSWVSKGDFGHLAQVQTIFEIRDMLLLADSVKVGFDSRIFNSFADSLAKMGSSSSGDFFV